MAVIGIDLGTTNSLACVYRDGKAELIENELGSLMTPSCVSVLEDGTILVGAAAKERLISHPDRTAASFKTWMGTEKTYSLGGRSFLPHELSALVLKKLADDARRFLGEEIEEAIISVPAYFNDNQRCATKLAAELAGLPVKRLINEPSAAALCYSHATGREDCRLLLVDFGGGTLDVSVVDCFENIIEIVAVAGDNHLGGNDVDQAIVDYFCRENGIALDSLSPDCRARLFSLAEAAKLHLSQTDMALPMVLREGEQSWGARLDRKTLRTLCDPLFARAGTVIARAVRDSGMSAGELDGVVLVGGSSRMAVFQEYLTELLSGAPSLVGNPDHIVAQGAGLCAGIKQRAEGLRDVVMTDVCPFSLGVASCVDQQDRNPHMVFLIPRSSMLPARRSEVFRTLYEDQKQIRVEVYQGEQYYASDNLRLGEILVQVPPDRAGSQWVEVTFAYDINGILEVTARGSGGDVRRRVIVNPKLDLSEQERERIIASFEELSIESGAHDRDRYLLARAERLFAELTGPARREAAFLIQRYQAIIRSGRQALLARERDEMQERLDRLEAFLQADWMLGGWGPEDEDEDWDEEDDE
ncbi:Hsp70 family protein [Anaeromassilibacillus sp. An200]|uniref:Hsp70 family protein n=1 Tax=Anaeromassilibacillus sp. An200 TaxID=1965587 RepID=UPI0013A61B8D|nr:Hsp70 family protein [Anaeromassilibacillus sp. An200]